LIGIQIIDNTDNNAFTQLSIGLKDSHKSNKNAKGAMLLQSDKNKKRD
jgi:hypothetical protein